MPTIPVQLGDRSYDVVMSRGAFDRAGELLAPWMPAGPMMVVSDANVAPLYAQRLLAQLPPATLLHEIPAGEGSKSLKELERLYDALQTACIPRDGGIVALGGGVVSDLAGFAAATWLRGVRWIAVPTSMIAMVDASVGGKVAIDFGGVKNLVGAFHQPAGVLIDPSLLQTLPEYDYLSGLAEVLKSACLDARFFAWLQLVWTAILAREGDKPDAAVLRAVRVKAEIVSRDETESGERRHLNLGHTVGHALEALAGGEQSHGACVAVGLCFATYLAEQFTGADPAYGAQIRQLATPLIPEGIALPEWEALVPVIAQDKKARSGGRVWWVLPVAPGEVRVQEVDVRELATVWENFRLTDQRWSRPLAS